MLWRYATGDAYLENLLDFISSISYSDIYLCFILYPFWEKVFSFDPTSFFSERFFGVLTSSSHFNQEEVTHLGSHKNRRGNAKVGTGISGKGFNWGGEGGLILKEKEG